MNDLKNVSFEILCGERQMTLANLNRNREYFTREQIANLQEYINDLDREIEKRWQDIKNNKQ